MNNIEDVINWLDDNKSIHDYKMIAITYNPSMKGKILSQGYFDIENLPIDISIFGTMLRSILPKYISNIYTVRLFCEKYSWLPKFIRKKDETAVKIEEYLNTFKWKRKYYGSYNISNIQEFYTIFYDYPVRYSYQDILLSSDDQKIIIDISHHGDIWIISDDIKLIEKLAQDFNSEGATVITSSDK